MGRGRQKAKQTKVARKLKYFSPETDYAALQRELAAQRGGQSTLGAGNLESDPISLTGEEPGEVAGGVAGGEIDEWDPETPDYYDSYDNNHDGDTAVNYK